MLREKKKKKKIKRLELRLSEEQYLMMKRKAANFPTMTDFVVNAIDDFDENGGIAKVDLINSWSVKLGSFKSDLARIGNNVNQIAHFLNIQRVQDTSDKYSENIDSRIAEVNELMELLKCINIQQSALVDKIIFNK